MYLEFIKTMETILVEYDDKNALSILEDLEKRKIIRIKRDNKILTKKISLSDKYKGVWTKEVANEFDLYIQKSREEW